MRSEHVCNDSFWVETRVRINVCKIVQCNTNTRHHRVTTDIYLMVPNESKFF